MEMIDLRSEGLQANTGARHPPATPYATTTPGESAVMFGVIIPVPLQKKFLLCWVGPIHYYTGRQHSGVILTVKTTPPAQHTLAGSSPVHTRIRGYSSPIAALGNQRRRAAQRAPTWDAQPAFLCFSLPGQGDWQFPALTTWRTLSFLVITKVPGLWTKLWPRDRWCDTAKGSGACESLGQTRHSRYTAYPPAGPRLHVSLLAARARAAQGLPPLRLELPKVTTPRNPASRVCFVCEEGTKHEHLRKCTTAKC